MPERKPCDGTYEDYLRHRYHKEDPCHASKKAWAVRQRAVRLRIKKARLDAARSAQ